MEKCFNKLTEFNKHLVRLHVHEIEENLGFLQPREWRSLRQQLATSIP